MSEQDKAVIRGWIAFMGEAGNWTPDDADVCDDGSVYVGLTMIAPKGTIVFDGT